MYSMIMHLAFGLEEAGNPQQEEDECVPNEQANINLAAENRSRSRQLAGRCSECPSRQGQDYRR